MHLVGEQSGSIATPTAVATFLSSEPKFLELHPELREDLGDFPGISYTQWEAFVALRYGIPLLV